MTKHKKIPRREIVPPPLPGVGIEQLNNYVCRWPLWTDAEPARRYCGEAAVPNWSYCHAHRLLAMRFPPKD